MNNKKAIQFDERGRNTLHTLLAHMMADEDTTRFIWDDTLRNAPFPDYMELEKLMIDAIYNMTQAYNGAHPTKENVNNYMITVYGFDAEQDINDIASMSQITSSSDRENMIRQSYANFLSWWQDVKVGMGLENMLATWNGASDLTKDERWEQIQKVHNEISPITKRRDIYRTDDERFDAFMDQHQRAIRLGHSAYPQFPFKKLNEKVNAIYPENPVLISGKSKSGKSLLVAELAEWFAWSQGLYVLVITLESDIRQWETRWWARHFGIPMSAWTKDTLVMDEKNIQHWIPAIDLDNPKWQQFISKDIKREYVERRNVGGGVIVLERTPGWSIPSLSRVINDNQRIADRMGKRLMVICDYLQKSVWANLGRDKELELLTKYANDWKVQAERTKMFSIMFSQETEDKSSGEIKAYGSSIPHTVFQLQLSIQRPPITDKKTHEVKPEYVLDKNRALLKDAFGNIRMYAKEEGDLSGENAKIVIVNANDGSRGAVPVLVEGGMASVIDKERAFELVQNDSGQWVNNPWGIRKFNKISYTSFQ